MYFEIVDINPSWSAVSVFCSLIDKTVEKSGIFFGNVTLCNKNLEKYSLIFLSAKLLGEDYHINGCNRHYLFNLSGFEHGVTLDATWAGRSFLLIWQMRHSDVEVIEARSDIIKWPCYYIAVPKPTCVQMVGLPTPDTSTSYRSNGFVKGPPRRQQEPGLHHYVWSNWGCWENIRGMLKT